MYTYFCHSQRFKIFIFFKVIRVFVIVKLSRSNQTLSLTLCFTLITERFNYWLECSTYEIFCNQYPASNSMSDAQHFIKSLFPAPERPVRFLKRFYPLVCKYFIEIHLSGKSRSLCEWCKYTGVSAYPCQLQLIPYLASATHSPIYTWVDALHLIAILKSFPSHIGAFSSILLACYFLF